jgi:hypothetical protein
LIRSELRSPCAAGQAFDLQIHQLLRGKRDQLT